MSTNNIDTVREHLFETLKGLTDKKQPMDLERAKAVCETAQTIINSAKVEVDYIKAVGGTTTSAFLQSKGEDKPALPNGSQKVEYPNGISVIAHRMCG